MSPSKQFRPGPSVTLIKKMRKVEEPVEDPGLPGIEAEGLPGIEAKVVDSGEREYVLNDEIDKGCVEQDDEVDGNSESGMEGWELKGRGSTLRQKYIDLGVLG